MEVLINFYKVLCLLLVNTCSLNAGESNLNNSDNNSSSQQIFNDNNSNYDNQQISDGDNLNNNKSEIDYNFDYFQGNKSSNRFGENSDSKDQLQSNTDKNAEKSLSENTMLNIISNVNSYDKTNKNNLLNDNKYLQKKTTKQNNIQLKHNVQNRKLDRGDNHFNKSLRNVSNTNKKHNNSKVNNFHSYYNSSIDLDEFDDNNSANKANNNKTNILLNNSNVNDNHMYRKHQYDSKRFKSNDKSNDNKHYRERSRDNSIYNNKRYNNFYNNRRGIKYLSKQLYGNDNHTQTKSNIKNLNCNTDNNKNPMYKQNYNNKNAFMGNNSKNIDLSYNYSTLSRNINKKIQEHQELSNAIKNLLIIFSKIQDDKKSQIKVDIPKFNSVLVNNLKSASIKICQHNIASEKKDEFCKFINNNKMKKNNGIFIDLMFNPEYILRGKNVIEFLLNNGNIFNFFENNLNNQQWTINNIETYNPTIYNELKEIIEVLKKYNKYEKYKPYIIVIINYKIISPAINNFVENICNNPQNAYSEFLYRHSKNGYISYLLCINDLTDNNSLTVRIAESTKEQDDSSKILVMELERFHGISDESIRHIRDEMNKNKYNNII